MWELYIVRHGIAVERGTPGIADDDRPLTPKGERRMREVAAALAAMDLPVDRIVTSPLPRAKRTAEIVAEGLEVAGEIEIAPVLHADSTAHDVAAWLGQQPEAPLMIVGHNPTLDDLLSMLLLGEGRKLPFEFKKGGVACLERPSSDGQGHTLRWLATPRLLRKLHG